MNSQKLSLAINCLLWLSIIPGSFCDARKLQSRQDTSSELGAKQQQELVSSQEFHSPSRVLEKRITFLPNTRSAVVLPESPDNKDTKPDDKNTPKNTSSNPLDLNPLAIQEASKHNGKEKPEQTPSLTSPINFCISGAGRLGKAVIQNGKQFKTNEISCNGVPMGMIPAPDKTPSLRFFSPKNMDTVPAKKTFTVSLGVKNLAAGFFTPPLETYFAAPVQLDDKAVVIGHTHIVAQRVESLSSTELLDPRKFAFFKGIDAAQDKDGRLNAEVKDGLEPGVYRFSSMTAAANHQNIAVALAQHDSMDDMIYITVK